MYPVAWLTAVPVTVIVLALVGAAHVAAGLAGAAGRPWACAAASPWCRAPPTEERTETHLGSTLVVRNTRNGSRQSGELGYGRRPAVHP